MIETKKGSVESLEEREKFKEGKEKAVENRGKVVIGIVTVMSDGWKGKQVSLKG